jgi:hypothetical protein
MARDGFTQTQHFACSLAKLLSARDQAHVSLFLVSLLHVDTLNSSNTTFNLFSH